MPDYTLAASAPVVAGQVATIMITLAASQGADVVIYVADGAAGGTFSN